ncbi:MAG: hypothetical protein CSA75_00760 [Sorangium cellulosum]|nr:MAG: hypothetical protein CSA75_00760 [Sorangium cellulosum]
MLSIMGAATNAIPFPFIPSKMVSNVRGAIAYEVARSHGLTITNNARRVLSIAHSTHSRKAQLVGLASWAARRIFRKTGPFWMLSPAAAALETFALGHLLNRYFEEARKNHSVRVECDEALRIRRIIDITLQQTLSPDLVVPKGYRPDNPPGEDPREDITKLLDWALLSTASLPFYLLRRLDASFERVVADLKHEDEG